VEERQVDALRLEEPPRGAHEADHVRRFWDVIGSAVGDALEAPGDGGIMLSGGLDSACNLVAALERRPGVDAFSILTCDTKDLDERKEIDALLRGRRTVRWHPIDCSEGGGDSLDGLPLPDEPVTLGAAFRPAKYRLATTASARGFVRLLDGEGGDELFDVAGRLWDLLGEREWGAAARYLVELGPRRAILHEIIRPKLPAPLRMLWYERNVRRADPVPPWMSEEFRRAKSTREGLYQRERWIAYATARKALPAILGVAPMVGTRSVGRMYSDAAGIEARSPFYDRRVVELLPTLSSGMRVDAAGSKPFLRRALRGRVPPWVANQPKNHRLYEHLQTTWLQAAHVPHDPRLLRADLLAAAISGSETRVGVAATARQMAKASATVATLRWMAALEAKFGVHWAP
jgi:asparagine synthase (glutamine-hydrolysing)